MRFYWYWIRRDINQVIQLYCYSTIWWIIDVWVDKYVDYWDVIMIFTVDFYVGSLRVFVRFSLRGWRLRLRFFRSVLILDLHSRFRTGRVWDWGSSFRHFWWDFLLQFDTCREVWGWIDSGGRRWHAVWTHFCWRSSSCRIDTCWRVDGWGRWVRWSGWVWKWQCEVMWLA